jgi:FkbM family methyltransferase
LGGKICFRLSALTYKPPQDKRVIPWFHDNGDKTHRLNYDLNENCLVLDLGGYEGQWASDIFGMYRCEIHIFEPTPQFSQRIRQRFSRNPRIHVHEFGIADKDAAVAMQVAADGSSVFRSGGETISVRLVDAIKFLDSVGINHIDLMKINIEGGEYDLLDRLIAAEFVPCIRNIQVQFHDCVPDAAGRMKRIQEALSHSHRPTYQYEFVWENWEAKEWPPNQANRAHA